MFNKVGYELYFSEFEPGILVGLTDFFPLFYYGLSIAVLHANVHFFTRFVRDSRVGACLRLFLFSTYLLVLHYTTRSSYPTFFFMLRLKAFFVSLRAFPVISAILRLYKITICPPLEYSRHI